MTTAYITLALYCTLIMVIGLAAWYSAGRRLRTLRDRETRLRRIQEEFAKQAEKNDWF